MKEFLLILFAVFISALLARLVMEGIFRLIRLIGQQKLIEEIKAENPQSLRSNFMQIIAVVLMCVLIGGFLFLIMLIIDAYIYIITHASLKL
jgi:flagellar biosynthesis protein FlhB